MISRRRSPSVPILFSLLLLTACFFTGITGPAFVGIGQSVTYDVAYDSEANGPNATSYGFIDVPAGWVLTSATFDGTVNGGAVSGTANQIDPSTLQCGSGTPLAPGYQRFAFSSPTFPVTTSNDSGTLHVTFTIGGATGNFTLTAIGSGTSGQAVSCGQTSPVTLAVTVAAAADVPAMGGYGMLLLAAALAMVSMVLLRG